MIPLLVLVLLVNLVFAVALGFSGFALYVHARSARKGRIRLALEERWGPLLLGSLESGDSSLLTAAVRPGERLFFVDFVFRYATRLQGREREVLSEAVGPWLPKLVARFTTDADIEQRARAVRTVGTLGGDAYLPDLLAALDDRSPLVAMTAARALALRGHPEWVDLFLDRAERFREWSPRFFASMLAAAGPSASPHLREIAGDRGRALWIRRVAIDALAELNDLYAADVATATLAEADDCDLQCACLRLLQRIGTADNAVPVRRLLDSPDPMVRLCAISAIGELGDERDLPPLRAVLEASDMWVALNAARALRRMGDEAWLASLARTEAARARLAAQVLRETEA